MLVLQVAGEKRWLLYEPLLELPLKHQRYSKALGRAREPTDDLVLRAGDTLYLPRGWLHQAETSETDSLHLTVGINTYSWLDAAKAALAPLEQDADLRRGVASGGDEADEISERLRARLDPDEVARRRRRRFLDTRRPIREDGLTQLRALGRLDVETPVARRGTAIADLEEDDDGVGLVFEGREVRFPAHARDEVAACFEAEEPFRPSELPGDLDDAGRRTLVRRLVREGFLRVI